MSTPRHDYLRERDRAGLDGATTRPAFSVDRTKRYFAVLAALCEPRLRGVPHAPLPTVEQVVERLRPGWPSANRAAVQWNIDYLAVKLRLKPGPDTADPGPRLNGKKESLVSLALRFDLVREDDLGVLAPAPRRRRPMSGPRPVAQETTVAAPSGERRGHRPEHGPISGRSGAYP